MVIYYHIQSAGCLNTNVTIKPLDEIPIHALISL